jgi:hypothetical protein
MSGQYDSGSGNRMEGRDTHNILMQAATLVAINYNNSHDGIECYLVEGSHEGQLTHSGHMPIFIENNSIHLYGQDEDNELIAGEIVRRCKDEGIDIKVLYD